MISFPIAAEFGEVLIAEVLAHQVDAQADGWAAANDALTQLETEAASKTWLAPDKETDERIAGWHQVYRQFGSNPRRVRPSVEALCRRLARTSALPRVNGPVDAYNAVSVRHVVAAGAFDLDKVSGEIEIRHAQTGDEFTPLGEPDLIEHPPPGEVVYADQESVLTRHWNHRDCDRTKVTSTSRTIVFLLETAHGPAARQGLTDAADDLVELVQPCSASPVSVTFIRPTIT